MKKKKNYKFCNKDKGNKMKKVKKDNDDLPWDVLGIICRELGFDDLFQFAGVCKSWRIIHKYYWANFMESQSPLIVEIATKARKVCYFLSIPDLKIYRSTMQYLLGLDYCGSSSGYLIMGGCYKKNKKLLLMNPFTRRKKEINTSALEDNLNYRICCALLAFVKGSEEFVIVVRRSCSLHVYQSRNSSWVTYSIEHKVVVDFVVLHNTIYALTNWMKIGVLSLNSARVKFLDLKNTPNVIYRNRNPRLATCDGQLLVVQFEPERVLNVYKIDFSTMEYVKLETMGDLALFYSNHTKCYALSNPGRWGYDSNSVYFIRSLYGDPNPKCEVYSWNNELIKCIARDEFGAPNPKQKSSPHWQDWCFRHQRDEVDYSLVD